MSYASQAQIEANRRNAGNGHGPNTPRGKGRSSQNAIRHGLTGRIVVLPTEDMEVYKAFSKELVDSLNPDTQWRLNRARTYEDGMIALGHSEEAGNFDAASPEIHSALTAAKVFRDNSKAFVNLSLYEQRLSRQQKEAFRQLRELQAERKAAAVDEKPIAQTEVKSAGAITSEKNGFVYADTEYDPGAFDPIFFKNSVPAPNWPQIQNKEAA
jgi:hypothetical protein